MISVQDILDTEKYYGHELFLSGLNSMEEGEQKLKLLRVQFEMLQTMDDKEINAACDIESNIEDDSSNYAIDVLRNMIHSNLLSVEAAALILGRDYPDYNRAYEWVEREFMEYSSNAYYFFQALYARIRYNLLFTKYDLEVKLKNNILKAYAKKYANKPAENSFFVGKGAIYTVITGGYDELRDPQFINPELDYFCYTDTPDRFSSDVWEIRELKNSNISNNIVQRWAKTHPHVLLPEYDFTIYIDGTFCPKDNIMEYVNTYQRGCSMLCFPHGVNTAIEQEAKAILKLGKGDPSAIMAQIAEYKNAGYSDNRVLVETGCLVRSNKDEHLIKVMEDWWHEISHKTNRDQLSLGYVCWKNDYYYDICALYLCNNMYLDYRQHVNGL